MLALTTDEQRQAFGRSLNDLFVEDRRRHFDAAAPGPPNGGDWSDTRANPGHPEGGARVKTRVAFADLRADVRSRGGPTRLQGPPLSDAQPFAPSSQVGSVTVTCSVLKGVQEWILAPSTLTGCSLYATDSAVSYLLTPSWYAIPLLRRGDGLLFLQCTPGQRGNVLAGNGGDLLLLIDTGAAMNVAGTGFEDILLLGEGVGRSARGVGNNVVPSLAVGTLTIVFQTPRDPGQRVTITRGQRPMLRRIRGLALGTGALISCEPPPVFAFVPADDVELPELADPPVSYARFQDDVLFYTVTGRTHDWVHGLSEVNSLFLNGGAAVHLAAAAGGSEADAASPSDSDTRLTDVAGGNEGQF